MWGFMPSHLLKYKPFVYSLDVIKLGVLYWDILDRGSNRGCQFMWDKAKRVHKTQRSTSIDYGGFFFD